MRFFVLQTNIVRVRPCPRCRVAAITLTAGIAAGLVSWIACEWAHDVFRPRLFAVPRWEAVWMEPTRESQYAAGDRHRHSSHEVVDQVPAFPLERREPVGPRIAADFDTDHNLIGG